MNTPAEKSGTVQLSSPAKTGAPWHAPSASSASWPAPARKSSPLVLKKPTGDSASPLPQVETFLRSSGATPFPAPAQTSAFDVPRPVAFQPTSSPWAPPVPKSDALVLRRSGAIQVEMEFSRPPFRLDRSPAHSPRELSRTC